MIHLLLSILLSAPIPNLSKKDIKQFVASFKVMEEAHLQGQDDIVAKYGESLLDRYDLIQVSFAPNAFERIAYDSLASWVRRRKEVGGIVQALQNPITSFSEKIAAISTAERILQTQLSKEASQEIASALSQAARSLSQYSVDSLWVASQIISEPTFRSNGLQSLLLQHLDGEFTSAVNGGNALLTEFEARFPGYRSEEIRSHIDFNAIDEMNVALRSNRHQDLIPIYKNLPPSKQKRALKSKIEKIMYVRWQRARILEEEIKAAKDFLEVFKEEKDRSRMYSEIEAWLYYNINPAAQIQPGATPDGSLPQAPGPLPPSVLSDTTNLSNSLEAALANGPAYISPENETVPEPRILPRDKNRSGVKVGY
jgi:hypothetical protein